MKLAVPGVRSLVIGTFQVTRAFFVVLSKSYDASNAGNGAERCRLQHKMPSDMYDSIAAGDRSLGFRDRIPHSAFAKDFRSFVSSLYLARRDRRALFSRSGYIWCRSKPVDQRRMIFFKISVSVRNSSRVRGAKVSLEISAIVSIAASAIRLPFSVKSISRRRGSRGSLELLMRPRDFRRLMTPVMVAES